MRKPSMVLTALAVGVMTLSACSSKSDDTTAATEAAATEAVETEAVETEAAETEAAATEAAAVDYGVSKIKIVAAEYSKDNTKAFWDNFATAYKAKTGVELEVQVISWDSLDQQSSTMIQNNQAPDILNLNAYASYAADGLLWSADDVLSEAAKGDLLEAFQKSGTFEGKLYGMPDLSSARALFYNKTLFEKAGITEMPTTWDAFAEAAKKITALGDGNVGYAMPLGPEESQGEFSMWLFNNGGDWKKDGKWAINSPENVATLTFLNKLATEDKVTQNNPGKTNRADAFDLFKSGKAGMVIGFSPLAGALDEAGTVDYGVIPMPSGNGAAPQTFGVTDYLMAFKNDGKNKEAVKAFYDLYYQPDQVNTFIKAEGFLPVTKTGLEVFASDPKLATYLETLPNAHLTPTDDPTWDKVKLGVQQNLGAAIGGDPKKVLDDLQANAENGG